MAVCGDMLEVIVNALNSPSAQTGSTSSQDSPNVETSVCDGENARIQIKKPWVACLAENKRRWKEQATKEAEARAAAGTSPSSETQEPKEEPETIEEQKEEQ